MNLFILFTLGLGLQLSTSYQAFGLEDQLSAESGGGGGSGGGNPAPGTPTRSSANGSSVISIPCLREDHSIANGTADLTCASILPKCSELRSGVGGFEKSVKDTLSLKIWGFYNSLDLDLDRSTLTNLRGASMPAPICSVVGTRIQNASGSDSSFEVKDQKIAKRLSCGTRPYAEGHEGSGLWGALVSIGHQISLARFMGDLKNGNHLTLSFDGTDGSLWNSYLLGTYPWLIRKHAYQVLKELKPDLSNLNEVVGGSSAIRSELASLNSRMSTYYQGLSQQLRSSCQTNTLSLLDRCKSSGMSLTDPNLRLCTLVKAQGAVNGGVLPNLLLSEIMARVQKEYDQTFGKLMAPDSAFGDFFTQCADLAGNSDGFYGTSYRFKYSRTASCLFTNDYFKTYDNYSVHETTDTSDNRTGRLQTRIAIENHTVSLRSDTPKMSPNHYVINFGFAGFVESIIRSQICGQKTYNDSSICDSVNIPDQPVGISQ